MRRVYHPYWAWEDYRAGMWEPSTSPGEHRNCAQSLLVDPGRFLNVMRKMIAEWPTAAEHNLTATDTNRRAWLGAAASLYHCGSREHTTRDAWWSLTIDQQNKANAVAETLITEWTLSYRGNGALFPLADLAVTSNA